MTDTNKILENKSISLSTLKVMADPMRGRLVGLFASGPTTVQELAEKLGVPLTRLYYHVHLLEENGLLQVVDQHQRGGTVEKVYATTARTFLIDQSEFESDPQIAIEQASILSDFALGQTIKAIRKSVQDGSINLQYMQPHPQALQIRRGLGRLSKEKVERLHQRLVSLVEEFTTPDDAENEEGGEYMLALAFFPIRFDIPKEEKS